MKKDKYIAEFEDIPTPRQKMSELPVEERISNFREVELGFTEEEAQREARRCLSCRCCIGCGLCLAECDHQAIEYDQAPVSVTLEVDGVILAPGFEEYDARRKRDLGYSRYPDVVSSIEFERILSETGPYSGLVIRPSNGEIPARIAFLQCVGSREGPYGANYCSTVCCSVAVRQALQVVERIEDVEVTILHKDMRPFGRGSEEELLSALDHPRIQFLRANGVKVEEMDGRLIANYRCGDAEAKSEFDLVVLSVGMTAPGDARQLRQLFGIDLNRYRFCSSPLPGTTSRERIFVAGTFSGPEDITGSLSRAGAAVAEAVAQLGNGSRGDETSSSPQKQESLAEGIPDRVGVISEEPSFPRKRESLAEGVPDRVGVILCRYGLNLAGQNEEELLSQLEDQPTVAWVRTAKVACICDGERLAREALLSGSADGLVIAAACRPETHLPLFQSLGLRCGLATNRVGLVDLRAVSGGPPEAVEVLEQCRKAMGDVQERKGSGIQPGAVVFGGGLAAMTAAHDLSRQGHRVHLVTELPELGGIWTHMTGFGEGSEPSDVAASLKSEIEGDPGVEIVTGCTISGIDGEAGQYHTSLDLNGKKLELEHGVIIVATEAQEYRPPELEGDRVMSQWDLDRTLAQGPLGVSSVVMVQCVGCRNEERPYCAATCCSHALVNSLRLRREENPPEVTVLHRTFRVWGFEEEDLTEARELGVAFIEMRGQPEIQQDGTVMFNVEGPNGAEERVVEAERVILSTCVVPSEESLRVAGFLSIPQDPYGFLITGGSPLRPLEVGQRALFVCGLARFPQPMDRCLAQARAAAMQAGGLLKKGAD